MPDNRIAQYLAAKRANIERISVQDAYAAAQQNDGTTLIDTRPSSFRASEGAIPGAIVIERNVLEWRLDPTSPDCITEVSSRSVVICASSSCSGSSNEFPTCNSVQ